MFDPSAWRAGVLHEDFMTRDLLFVLGARSGSAHDSYDVVTGISSNRVVLTRHEGAAEDPPPLRIPIDAARALCDALITHFGGTSNSKQLRADYDAERSRVDKLTDSLIAIATREV
jgi:hypothetical protein